MPHRRGVGRKLDGEQGFDDAEQPGQHLGFGEVLLYFVVRETVALLLELFRGPGQVPAFQRFHAEFLPREFAQLGDIAGGEGARLFRHVALEGRDLGRGVGHLGRQRDFGEIRVAEHLRFFMAQGQQALDQRAVVALRRAELGGPRRVGAVHARAKFPVVAELQHGNVGRGMQGELPSLLAILFGSRLCGRLRILGQTPRSRLRPQPIRHGRWSHPAHSRKTLRPAPTALPGFP